MSVTAARLEALGIVLPDAPAASARPDRFVWVNIRGDRVFVAGHGPGEPGPPHGPLGRVGEAVTPEEARALARQAGISILGSLARAIGDLDRVAGWARVFGMVHGAPGFDRPQDVIDGASELILDVFGEEVGRHARSAICVAGLPFGMAVEIEAEVLLRG